MRKIISYISSNLEILGTFIIVVLISIFVKNKNDYIVRDGVFTVAKIIDFKGAEAGVCLKIEIRYKDRKYITCVDEWCKSDCIGKYYWAKISPEEPGQYAILYKDLPVPDCIISGVEFFKGWKTIPTCLDFSN